MWEEKNGDKLGWVLVKWIKRSRETKVAQPTNPFSSLHTFHSQLLSIFRYHKVYNVLFVVLHRFYTCVCKKERKKGHAISRQKVQFGEIVGHGGWLIGPKLFRPEAYLLCVSSKLSELIFQLTNFTPAPQVNNVRYDHKPKKGDSVTILGWRMRVKYFRSISLSSSLALH